jgi:trans-2,3-dihydro-3-hydroxyanthranilate isomerase
MADYSFLQVDVFTNRMFGGNPLAVFPDAQGLTSEQMQNLAREMNLSETTFVLPADTVEYDFKVRIFTPAVELPLAGHPVVGTHWVLAHLGRVALEEPVTRVLFELGVGILPAQLYVADGKVGRVVMTQDRPRFFKKLDQVRELAGALGVSPNAILDTDLPVQVVSTGVPQMMVPLRSLKEVQGLDAGNLDLGGLKALCESMDTAFVHVFCLETVDPEAHVHARGFGHLLGVPEDPATGSANGALAAYLVKHGAVSAEDSPVSLVCEQGLEMGRPSRIHMDVHHDGGKPRSVQVGGEVVLVAEGVVHL